MPMTITEKILAAHAGLDTVKPGDLIDVKVDMALANDITAPLAIRVFDELGVKTVFDREKIALIQDHFVPNKDIASAQQTKIMTEFARLYGIKYYFDLGDSGIEHVLLPEKGIVVSGDLVIGADSHTCTYGALGAFSTGMGSTDLGVTFGTGRTWLKVPETIKFVYEGTLGHWVSGKDLILFTLGKIGVEGAVYKTMEFAGKVIRNLSMDQRFTMTNMAVEGGAKNGIIEPDDITKSYLSEHTNKQYTFFKSDPDASYEKILTINTNEIEPQVALPHSPDNVKGISELDNIKIDQVFIGSCTNGRIEDLQIAAKVLKGQKVAKGIRLIVLPSTPLVYKEALQKGIIETLLDAGAVLGPPSCGPCLGGHLGILAQGEKAVSTTNRNFIGRMGHPESEVYLASPAIAAASAILGKIGSPDDI